MKFIAQRDFYRTKQLKKLVIIGGCKGTAQPDKNGKVEMIHEDHIHMGAIFELGSVKNQAELQRGKDDECNLINLLRYSGCIADASNAEEVANIELKVATEAKRVAEQKKRNEQADQGLFMQNFIGLMQSAVAANAEPTLTGAK